MTLGEKLQKLRKQSGLSQEVLAEKVAVTRQTISKWELDQSTPELSILAQLSEIFHVSTDYLIKDAAPETVVTQPKKRTITKEKLRRILLVLITAAVLIAGIVCLICDYFTAMRLSWSLIAVAAIVAGWLVLLPVLAAKEKILEKTVCVLSLVPIPLLAVLAVLLGNMVIIRLGAGIALAAIAAVWVMYAIFAKNAGHFWRAAGFSLWVIMLLSFLILYMVARFFPIEQSGAFNGIITFLLSLVCFGVDYLHGTKIDGGKK